MSVELLPATGDQKSLLSLFHGALHDLTHKPKGNIALLDVLRSIAIVLVFCGHFAADFKATPAILRLPIFYWGWTGVDIFFILSGLLIGTQLWKELRDTSQIRIGRFLLRRGFRIWPLYWAVAVFILMEALFFHRSSSGLQFDVLFLSDYFHSQIGGSWSLSIEEQFYILAPVSIYLISRKLKLSQCWVFPVAGLFLLPVLRAIHAHGSTLNVHDLRQEMYFPFHTHSDGLAMGLLIAWCRVARPNWAASIRLRTAVSAAMVLMAVGLYALNAVVFNFTSIALLWGAVTFWGTGLTSVPAVFKWHGFYLISRLSYGIYLNHFGILAKLGSAFATWSPEQGSPLYWVWMPLSFLACMAFAALTFQLIEWPFLQLRSRIRGLAT